MAEEIFFGVCEEVDRDVEVYLVERDHKLFQIKLCKQQAAELGALLLALAGDDFDFDSIPELLDGFDLPMPKCLKDL